MAESLGALPLSAVETRFAEMGLPTYAQAIEQITFLTENAAGRFAVLIGDADGLKDVNDGAGGHLAGDKLIIETGEVLAEQTSAKGFVTLGRRKSRPLASLAAVSEFASFSEPAAHHRKGDEFIIVLPGLKQQTEVDTWVDHVQAILAGRGIGMTLSGRAHLPDETASELLMGVDRLLKFDKGLRSIEGKTPEQIEVARKIGELAATHGLSLRELPKIIGYLPFLPYGFEKP